jgi:flagellum-specific peptidoglycan hydrolase FlgJ
MKYAITFFLVVVLAIIPQSVTTATRATQYKPANVPKTNDVPKVGTKVAFHDKVALQALVAIQNAKNKGLKTPLPSFLIALVCVESGYGSSYLSKQGNNFTGVRAKNKEPFILAFDDGKMQKFRRFNSLSESITAAIIILNKPQYAPVFKEQNTYAQAVSAQMYGYCTNRRYGKLLNDVAIKYNLKRYDK